MGRPKTINPKKKLSISVNIELDAILNKICQEKNINKSKYIQYLIKKEMDKS